MLRRFTLAFAVLALVVPAAAEAQGLPSCPSDQSRLQVRAADVAVVGKGMSVTVRRPEEYSDEYRPVVNLVLTVARDAPVPLTLPDDEGSVTAVVETPDALWFNAVVEWDQNVGKPSACHGRAARQVWAAPAGKTFGNPRIPRFAGTYAVKYRALNYKDTSRPKRIRWRVRPRCDLFACRASLRSSGGMRSGMVRPRSNGAYRFTNSGSRAPQSCSVTEVTRNSFTGEVISRKTKTIKRAWVGRDRITLKVLKVVDGQAVLLRGLRTYTMTPTGNASYAGCTKTYHLKDRVTLRLR